MKKLSQNDLCLITLEDRSNEWVPMPVLVQASGSYNIHTRISELRHHRGCKISNKQEYINGKRHSYYKLEN